MERSFSFGVDAWSAWSPSLRTSDDWMSWVESPFSPVGSERPKVEGMQPMNRRRLKQLGGMALETAYNLPETTSPIIFCSQEGESDRCYELLKELTETGALSPQSFSLAVHNAIPSLYTIDKKLNSNVIAISSSAGVFSALVEAIGLFAAGEKRVRVIVAQEPTPEIYKSYCDFPDESYAYSIDLVPDGRLSLKFTSAQVVESGVGKISTNLGVLKFLLSQEKSYNAIIDATSWELKRG